MRNAFTRPFALLTATAFALCVGTGCSPQNVSGTGSSGGSASSDSSATSVASTTSAAGTSSTTGTSSVTNTSPVVSTSSTTSTTSATGATSTTERSSIDSFGMMDQNSVLLYFKDDEGGAKLVADMQAGRLPTECSVLYDQMGALPEVRVTDPAAIQEIYELVKCLNVIGPSNMSITDNYHHVSFTLQDGTTVGYSFEGEGNLSRGRDNYFVVGDGPLWSYVRRLQSDKASGEGRYAITFSGDDDFISSLPPHAYAGDTVSFVTSATTGGWNEVYLDGTRLEPVPNYSTMYAFAMPDHDVTVELRFVDDGAGS